MGTREFSASVRKWFFALIFLTSCSPSSLGEIRNEVKKEALGLTQELSLIETKEELAKKVPSLRKRFLRLSKLLVDVRKFSNDETAPPAQWSEELFIELSRLYEIPGCQALIEASQEEAILYLNLS